MGMQSGNLSSYHCRFCITRFERKVKCQKKNKENATNATFFNEISH